MTVPILLVTGFLGAGKTTFINALLENGTRRIAAIVNDFGAINIDAELLEGKADAVIGLGNGCICCTLQGDLLRSLKAVLAPAAGRPMPEAIVIEASGVSDPRGIIETLSDPVLWNVVRLDTVLCVVDAEGLAQSPGGMEDPLWQAQLRASDYVILSKAAGAGAEALARLQAAISAGFRLKTFIPETEGLPMQVLFTDSGVSRLPLAAGRVETAERFAALEWQSDHALPFDGFQKLIEELAPALLRAKGFINLRERPGRALLFQLVGRRAGMESASQPHQGCRLVLIGEAGQFDPEATRQRLNVLVRDAVPQFQEFR